MTGDRYVSRVVETSARMRTAKPTSASQVSCCPPRHLVGVDLVQRESARSGERSNDHCVKKHKKTLTYSPRNTCTTSKPLFQVTAVDRKAVSDAFTFPVAEGNTFPGGGGDFEALRSRKGGAKGHGKDVLDASMSLDDQDEDGADRENHVWEQYLHDAGAGTRASFTRSAATSLELQTGVGGMVAALAAAAVPAAAVPEITAGAFSGATGTTTQFSCRGQQDGASLRPADPPSFEKSDASTDTSHGRNTRKRREYPVWCSHRRWTSSRSPSSVRSDGAATVTSSSSPSRHEPGLTPAARIHDPTSKVCERVCAVCAAHFVAPKPNALHQKSIPLLCTATSC